jgi:hypothetical protein
MPPKSNAEALGSLPLLVHSSEAIVCQIQARVHLCVAMMRVFSLCSWLGINPTSTLSDILQDLGGAWRYLYILAYGSATLQAPDDSLGWDETGSASPVVSGLTFSPTGLGFYSPWDCQLHQKHLYNLLCGIPK